MKKIAVIGTGTAGVVSIAHCLAFFPQEWEVTSIYDPNIPMLGIGESTSTQIPLTLFYGADLNLLDGAEELDATIKHGVKYVNWRETDFFTKIPPPFYAMHFNNFKLKDFAFERFEKRWGDKFKKVEGEITKIVDFNEKVTVTLADNTEHYFDYLIDCRGYPDDYSDYLDVDIPVNHCLVHTINEPGDWKYTYHYAHPNGWMFGIPLETRQGWGYLYNDKITSKEEAVNDIAKIFNTDISELNLREFGFKNYKAKKFIEGRIVRNGNRALFFEPLEALSGWMYDSIIRTFFDVVVANMHTEESANMHLHSLAEDYELFIHYMYHGGSVYDSDFWKITKEKSTKKLNESTKFNQHVQSMKGLDPAMYTNQALVYPFPLGVWKQIDKDMQYHYFK
jgi:hypothetical protein